MMELYNLNDRVILLTGASGHFGRVLAEGLAVSGARVILAGRTRSNLDAVSERLAEKGYESDVLELEVGNNESHRKAIDYIGASIGRLDGIVNNAYSGRVGNLDTITGEDFENACMQNLSGPFGIVQAALPLLEAASGTHNGGSSVVNISSMYGRVSPDPRIYGDTGNNNPVHYGATKAGMIQMTRYLACHLADRGIRVNSVSPGAFPPSDIKINSPKFHDRLVDKVPMHRIGDPEEIVGPVMFFLSSMSSYVTGADLPVDGGWTAW